MPAADTLTWRTLLRPDALQWYLWGALLLAAVHYVVQLWATRRVRKAEVGEEEAFGMQEEEGFAVGGGGDAEDEEEGGVQAANTGAMQRSGTEAATSTVSVLDNDRLYDRFYARVYDTIVGGAERSKAEVAFTLAWARGTHPEASALRVLDIGCGTGGGVAAFAESGVGKVVGLDRSEDMVSVGKKRHPKADLRVGEAETVSTFAAGEFNLVTAYYFTPYYLRDRAQVWRNAFQWMEPGGMLVLHAVNRRKFDPILESASPFVAFSVQKYARERVTKSRVAFDKFDYHANFALTGGDEAEFREEFRFKGPQGKEGPGRLRKQVHRLRMPDMDSLVKEVEGAGFVFRKYIDLAPIAYEYMYLFCFSR